MHISRSSLLQLDGREELLVSTINSSSIISLSRLQKICFGGIDENTKLRPLCWKILLNYLPLNKRDWPEYLDKQRKLYYELVKTLVVDLSNVSANCNQVDDPLTRRQESKWNTYFDDNKIISQITSDCIRICPGMAFFLNKTSYPLSVLLKKPNIDGILKKRINVTTLSELEDLIDKSVGISESQGTECHWESISRILYIYAKCNKGIDYVQGMNEILAPIYYVFACDTDKSAAKYAECDAFFCFSNIMGEIHESFIKVLDNNINIGSGKMMHHFMCKLKELRPDLHNLICKKGIKPEFFSFRWLTLLFSQEFKLPDVIMLWDIFFSDPNRFEFMYVFGVAMISLLEENIVNGDFTSILKSLLNFPTYLYGIEKIHKIALDMYAPAWEMK